MIYSDLIDRATALAAIAHRGQTRKHPTRDIPYIAHCTMVGTLLAQAGFPDHVVAAGILHDVVEDTDVTLGDLGTQLSPAVADLVAYVTESDKSLPWETRKAQYHDVLKTAPPEALAIAAADKIHNTRSLLAVLHDLDAENIPRARAFERFKRSPRTSLATQRHALHLIQTHKGTDPRLDALTNALEAAINDLDAALPPE